MESSRSFGRNLLELNLAILFISTSGSLGKYIEMSPMLTIGVRAGLASLFLFLFCKYKNFDFRIAKEDRLTVISGGILMGIHWVTYFMALQLSNVAIAMITVFTYPAFTAILEPLILKTKVLKIHLLMCLFIMVGIYFLVPEFKLADKTFQAIIYGIISSLTYAIRLIMVKSKIQKYNGSLIMMYQVMTIACCLIPTVFVFDISKVGDYLLPIIALALFTTTIGHTLFLYSLNYFSTVTASIISCIQPLYGIILGMIFLNDYPKSMTWIGGGIILISVAMESVRVYLKDAKPHEYS